MARAIRDELQHDRIDVVLWNQIFKGGDVTWRRLLTLANDHDFAVFVFNADDTREMRGVKSGVTRDNVLLEYGLLAGSLGPKRTFFMFDRRKKPMLPSDVAGVTPLTYEKRPGQPLDGAIGPLCEQLRNTISQLGRRSASAKRSADDGRLNKELSGSWVTAEPFVWKRVIKYRERFVLRVVDDHVSGTITGWDSQWNGKQARWGAEVKCSYAVEGSYVDGTIAAQYRSRDGRGGVGAFIFKRVSGELVGGCTYLSSARKRNVDLKSDNYRLVRGTVPGKRINDG